MALTATANAKTRGNVMKSLEMTNTFIISKVPNNPNLFLSVLPKPADCDPAVIVEPIVKGISKSGVSSDRFIVFCRTYSETLEFYQEAVLQLHDEDALYVNAASFEPQSHRRTCEKYDACTAESIKKHIVSSFTEPDGTVQVVFATIAFAMGLDSPNIRHIVHWGPPADIETYLQEVGRSGRDGRSATAILFYQPTDFRGRPGVSESMRDYCINTHECRRKELMKQFGLTSGINYPTTKCLCCDVCLATCPCQSCQLPDSYVYFRELTRKTADNYHSMQCTTKLYANW